MALDVFREMSQLKKRLASLNGLTQVHEKPRVQIAMAKLSALIEDVELDLSEAFTSIAREIVTEAEYLADEIETRLAQGHFSETIH